MLIILESADCAGKTTLYNYLVYNFAIKPINTPRQPGPLRDLEFSRAFDNMLLQTVIKSEDIYILDRHTPSNYAYGIMRDEPSHKLSSYIKQWLDFVQKAGSNLCTIWLTRYPKTINDDLISLTLQQDKAVLNAYSNLARTLNQPMFNVISGIDNYEDILAYISTHWVLTK